MESAAAAQPASWYNNVLAMIRVAGVESFGLGDAVAFIAMVERWWV